MTIKITPIEGARLITKPDVEKQQKPEDIEKITNEEWQEAINILQNAENLLVHFNKTSYSFFKPFRKNIITVFYENYPEMVDLNTSNLEELYGILKDFVIDLMPDRFIYVTGKVKAVKSMLDWDKNQSTNLDKLLNFTEEESKKIDKTAPTSFVFNIARLEDAFSRQKEKKPEEYEFTQEEIDLLIESFLDGSELREKNAMIAKKLYTIVVSEIMDVFLFNISHFSDEEIVSLRHRFIQDIYDFLSAIINKVNSFIYPGNFNLTIPKKDK